MMIPSVRASLLAVSAAATSLLFMPPTVLAQTEPAMEAEAPAAEPESPAVAESPTEGAATSDADSAAAEAAALAELESMASDDGIGLGGERVQLDVGGFADFNYFQFTMPKENRWYEFMPRNGSFMLGNLNLYFDGRIGDSFRSLIEVRLLFVPNGDESYDAATGTFDRRVTKSQDYAEAPRELNWTTIEIERAWAEYSFSDLLTVRGGLWLSPYGIWNVDHGTPVIISVMRPYVVGEQIIPERQMGLHAYGSTYLGGTRVGYNLTVSNGRIGNVPEYRDFDRFFSYGGRLFMEADWVGELKIGISGFGGRYTDRQRIGEIVTSPAPDFLVDLRVAEQYDELAGGIDLQWHWNDLVVLIEALYGEIRYTEKGRPSGGPAASGLVPDDDHYGVYALLGYRLPWFELLPYVLVEHYKGFSVDSEPVCGIRAGVNLPLMAELVAKVEYAYLLWVDPVPGTLQDDDLQFFATQIAWAF